MEKPMSGKVTEFDFDTTKRLAVDLAEFNNTSIEEALEYITQTGKHSNLGHCADLIELVYSKKYLIKKVGIKYWLLFWKRKSYLQKQVFNEIHKKGS